METKRSTLEVGPGRPFANIPAAFDSLNGKRLKADVLIKVADGVHETTGITLVNQPEANRIRIEGNRADPEACTLKFVPDGGKNSHGMIVRGLQGLHLAGFRFLGETSDANWTHRGLRLDQGAWVRCDADTIRIVGGCGGVEIVEGSHLVADGMRYEDVQEWNVLVSSGSQAWIRRSHIIGPGKDVRTRGRAPYGVLASDGSQVWLSESTLSGVWHGVQAARTSYAHCDVSTVKDAHTGFLAEWGGIVWAHNRGDQRAKASNCTHGYLGSHMSLVVALGAMAEKCGTGFIADGSSKVCANGGMAIDCDTGFKSWAVSEVQAHGTKAHSTGNKTLYSPPGNVVPGNENAIIRYS